MTPEQQIQLALIAAAGGIIVGLIALVGVILGILERRKMNSAQADSSVMQTAKYAAEVSENATRQLADADERHRKEMEVVLGELYKIRGFLEGRGRAILDFDMGDLIKTGRTSITEGTIELIKIQPKAEVSQ